MRPIAALVVLVTVSVSGTSIAQRGGTAASTAKVVALADAYLATLDASQRAKANPPLDASTRVIWSNLPTGIAMQVGATERNGLKLGAMSPAQEKAALAFLSAMLSAEGYRKVMQIVDADQVLEERSAPTRKPGQAIRFGRAEYYLAVLGKPSSTDVWMMQFGGHHLAINVTVGAAASVLTPTHTGTQPATYTLNGQTIRPLGDENDKAFALINSLDEAQRKHAILSFEMRNLALPPGSDGKMIQPEGLRANSMTADQRQRLLDVAGEWINILEGNAAAAKLAEVKAGLNDTYFAWSGSTKNGEPAYFRIQGPSVFIEYAPQGKGPDATDHIHTIYRDPTNEYGSKMTAAK